MSGISSKLYCHFNTENTSTKPINSLVADFQAWNSIQNSGLKYYFIEFIDYRYFFKLYN